MTSSPFHTATAQLSLMQSGELTSRELLDVYLDRIDQHSWVNAVVTVDVDAARSAADEADAMRRAGRSLGPLHGLPITVKHDHEVAGMLSTYGSELNADHRATRDAEAVARLRGAGAVIFGRTNLPEFATDGQSYNSLHGTTSNPWDPRRTTGGSSGGSAAAVAAGMTSLDLGSDMGGSIRIPAAWCGVFGLKPTKGVVPTEGAAPSPSDPAFDPSLLAEDIAVSGPLARSAKDLDLALSILAGEQGARLAPARVNDARRLRAAVWLDDARLPTSSETLEVLQTAGEALADAGVDLRRDLAAAPDLDELEELFESLFMSDLVGHLNDPAYEGMVPALRQRSDWMSRTHAAAAVLSHRDWLLLNARRNAVLRQWDRLFEDVDVVLTPVVFTTAPEHDHSEPVEERVLVVDGVERSWRPNLTRWCGAAGVAGLPSVTVPVGLSRSGLPVAVQIVAPRFADRTAIAAADILERVLGGYRVPPRVA